MRWLPKSKDEWRGTLFNLVAVPLLAVDVFLISLPFVLRVCVRWGLPEWRYENILRTYAEFLFLPVALFGLALLILTVTFAFLDRKHVRKGILILVLTLVVLILVPSAYAIAREKPVIYLYPEQTQEVRVSLDYPGRLTESDPPYNAEGWRVTASPDGALRDQRTGLAYPYLFWEGRDTLEFPMERGFVVRGCDAEPFLREKLALQGLNEQEIADFIEYWQPRLAAHPYNLVSFPNAAYANAVGLDVTPAPDTVLRVFMVFMEIDAPVEIAPQTFAAPDRRGFTVVEWGGTELE